MTLSVLPASIFLAEDDMMNQIDIETTDLLLALFKAGNDMALELEQSAEISTRESGDQSDGEYYRDLAKKWKDTAGPLAARWLALGS